MVASKTIICDWPIALHFPSSHLRVLLNNVKGAKSFEILNTVNGDLQPTFKAACVALGLLVTDNEWNVALKEVILMFCEVLNPKFL